VLILVLGGAVMTLRIFSTSERRLYAYAMLAFYVAVVALFLFGTSRPAGLAPADAERLGVTLAIWLGMVLVVEEFYPTVAPEAASKDQA